MSSNHHFMQADSQIAERSSNSTAAVPEPRMTSPLSFPLSPLDHIMPHRYTFRLLFFPTGDRAPPIIAASFKAGLRKTLDTISLLSGTVKPFPCSTQSGRLRITAPWNSIEDIFHIAHQPDLSYDVIRSSGFSMRFLEFEELLPMFKKTNIDPFSTETPVIMVQLLFIKDGMIMGFCLHHSFADGAGAPEVLKIWAAFCRGEEGPTKEEVFQMTTRERVMTSDSGEVDLGKFYEYVDEPLPEDLEEKIEATRASTAGTLNTRIRTWLDRTVRRCASCLPHVLFLPITPTARVIGEFVATWGPSQLATLITYFLGRTQALSPPEIATAIFFFPAPSLSLLKTLLSVSLLPGTYISTNDALSALCFACLTHAREPSMPTSTPPDRPLDLAINLDGRRLTSPPLPPNWLGNLTLHAQISAPLSSVTPPTTPGLLSLALRLRQRILALDTAYVDDLVASLSAVEDISRITPSFIWGRKTGTGMLVASWAGQGWYAVEWGAEVGCRCERMRLPKVRFQRYNGFCVIFPRIGRGSKKGREREMGGTGSGEVRRGGGEGVEDVDEEGLEVMVGLERGAMDRLMGMEMWTRFGRWRCE